jgi:hypothetical protein
VGKLLPAKTKTSQQDREVKDRRNSKPHVKNNFQRKLKEEYTGECKLQMETRNGLSRMNITCWASTTTPSQLPLSAASMGAE